MEEKDNTKERKVHGTLPLSNWGGLEISLMDVEHDYMYVRDNYGTPGEWVKTEILHTIDKEDPELEEEDCMHFVFKGTDYKMSEVLRI